MDNPKETECKIVIASHGKLASGIIDSAQVLLGEQENLKPLCLLPSQSMENFAGQIREKIDQYGSENVLLLTDLMNGTPFNAVVSLVRNYPVIYHITGVNLATVIGALVARNRGASMEEICEAALQASRNSILDVRKMLEGLNLEDDK